MDSAFMYTRSLLAGVEEHEASMHKDLFPLVEGDYWGFLLCAMGLMIAASGGIGGGGILVPLLILVFEFSPKFAIPLSNFTILGASITNMILNLQKRHPTADRPLVDWDLIVMMEPLTMLGAIVGSYVGKILPDELLVLMLVLLLGATTHRTTNKGIKKWKEESAALLKEQTDGEGQGEKAMAAVLEQIAEEEEEMEHEVLLDANRPPSPVKSAEGGESVLIEVSHMSSTGSGSETSNSKQEGKNKKNSRSSGASSTSSKTKAFPDLLHDAKSPASALPKRDDDDEGGPSVQEVLESGDGALPPRTPEIIREQALAQLYISEQKTPLEKVKLMTFMFVVVVIMNLLKGGGGAFPSPIGLECGGVGYWMLTLMMCLFLVAIALYVRAKIILPSASLKRSLGYRYQKGDVRWNARNSITYPLICIAAGMCAGMFGIGGGIVKGPLMLELGVDPLVAAASVAVMIFYTSVAASTSFIAFGTLTWDYGMALFVLGLTTTAVGQLGVGYLVKKYKRTSLVALSIAAVVGLSTVLMALHGVMALADETMSPDSNSIC